MFLDSSLLINQKKLEGIEKDLTCPICQGIINDPYFCSKCQNNFCNNCITKWKENNTKCPYRCKDPEYINNRFLKKIFTELLKFKCQKGCEEIISYKDVNIHYESCPKQDFQEKYYECATQVEILKVQIENYNDLQNELNEVKERNDELEYELNEKKERNNELEYELDEVKEKNNDLENELENEREKNNDYENEIDSLNKKIGVLKNDLNNQNGKNIELEKEIQILKNKNDDLDKYTKICNEKINELENKIKKLSNEKNTLITVNRK